MKKIFSVLTIFLSFTLFSCNLITKTSTNGALTMGFTKPVMEQIKFNIRADTKEDPSKVEFKIDISGDYKNSDSKIVDFEQELTELTFSFDKIVVGSVVSVELQVILCDDGTVLYSDKQDDVIILEDEPTKVNFVLGKVTKPEDSSKGANDSPDKIGITVDLNGTWVTTEKIAYWGYENYFYWLEKGTLTSNFTNSAGKTAYDYCFDGDGNSYFIRTFDNKLYKNSQTDGFYECQDGGDEFTIAYDYARNMIVYSYYFDDYVYFATLDPNDTENFSVTQKNDFQRPASEHMAANNGHIYYSTSSNQQCTTSTIMHYKYDFSNNVMTLKYVNELNLIDFADIIPMYNPDSCVLIVKDMIVQSGCLFVLYENSDLNLRNAGRFNNGGILMLNLETLEPMTLNGKKVLGNTTEKRTVQTGEEYNFLYTTETPDSVHVFTGTAHIYGYYDVPAKTISSFTTLAPESSSSTEFYVPERIVGITPKTFYILDRGLTFSNDGSYLVLTVVNRIVAFDLETGSFKEILKPKITERFNSEYFRTNYYGNFTNGTELSISINDFFYDQLQETYQYYNEETYEVMWSSNSLYDAIDVDSTPVNLLYKD